ncbi:hypothetical protein HDU84_002728 [Entophlyctis sp. JEL0112]|nr:hypothetical protein HDU84_002728 [Entophlyctis sp. JEL0112]
MADGLAPASPSLAPLHAWVVPHRAPVTGKIYDGDRISDSVARKSAPSSAFTPLNTQPPIVVLDPRSPPVANSVEVDNVYLNGLHALRWLHLHNPSPTHKVSVRIKSTLGSQLAFQLTNENLTQQQPLARAQSQTVAEELIYDSMEGVSSRDSLFSLPPLQALPSSAMPIPLPAPKALKDEISDVHSTDIVDSFAPDSPFSKPEKPDDSDPVFDTPTPFKHAVAAESKRQKEFLHFHSPPDGDLQQFDQPQSASVDDSKRNNHDYQFNQLFNYVNYVEHVELRPGQTLPLVLAFLPDGQNSSDSYLTARSESPENLRSKQIETASSIDGSSTVSSVSQDSDLTHQRRNLSTADGGEDLHDFFEVSGLIFFFAFVKPVEAGENQLNANQPTGEILGDVDNASLALSGSSSTRDVGSPDFQVTLKFHSRVCRSVLWTDVGETGIFFDGCVVGGTYFKDFSIWNKSEIDLYWMLNTIDLSSRQNNSWLSFSDYDTAEPLDFSRPIPSYSQRRIRVTFKPTEAGEFSYDLQLENCNDSAGNTVQALVTADVRTAPAKEILQILDKGVVDFGDCYTGCQYKQQITIKNLIDVPVDVYLTVEDGVDLVFLLKGTDPPNRENSDEESSKERIRQHLNYAKATDETSKTVNRRGRIRELTGTDSSNTSDFSNPTSSINSRTSSPAAFQRFNSEITSSSIDAFDVANTKRFDDIGSIFGGDIIEDMPGLGFMGDRRSKDGDEVTRIEEICLRSGSERTLDLCFRPSKDPVDDLMHISTSGGRLMKRSFKITLTYSKQGSNEKERKTVQCKARTCTSIVEVSPRELDFGDTDVGTLKSLPITVFNRSELPGKIEVQFVSKVLQCHRGEVLIPPKQSVEVKIDIYPRKVNPDYCKEVTVVNLYNSENNQVVKVKSTHIDKNRVTFHSLFYRILTPGSTNFLDFGTVVLNSPAVRSFSIENTSKKRLKLELSSPLAEELLIFSKASAPESEIATVTSNLDSLVLKEKLIDSLDGKKSKRLSPLELTSLSIGSDVQETSASLIETPMGHMASIISQTPQYEPNNGGEVKKPEYLDLASFRTVHNKEVKMSPGRKIASAMVASSSEGLQQLRRQYRDGHGFSNETEETSDFAGNSGYAVSVSSTTNSSALNALDTSSQPKKDLPEVSKQRPLGTPRFSSARQSANSGVSNTANAVGAGTGTTKSGGVSIKSESISNASKMSIETFLRSIEEFTGVSPPVFSKQSTEEKYVKAYQFLLRELGSLIKDGRLSPVNTLDLQPGAEISLIAVMTAFGSQRPYVQTKSKKYDSKILIRLLEFDRDIHQPQFEALLTGEAGDIPVRELMIRCSLCRSMMELGQRNINFGYLDKNEAQTKTIVVRNKSETPLFYYLRKSGSIASGDITIPDSKIGLIRGYGKREIEFAFEPSLAGQYQEKVTVENLQDRENDQTLTIKANIRQPSKFSIDTLEIDFGPCLAGEFSRNSQRIMITNTTSKIRMFEVKIDDEKLQFRNVVLDVRLEAVGGDGLPNEDMKQKQLVLTKEMMEQIEELEQKLKIYRRKGKTEKIKKAEEKLEKLKLGSMDDDIGKAKDESDLSNGKFSANETDQVAQKVEKARHTAKSLVVWIEPRAIKTIKVHVKPIKKQSPLPLKALSAYLQESEVCQGAVFVHEYKNTDVMKNITLRCVVCFEPMVFKELMAAEGHFITSQHNAEGSIIFDNQETLLSSTESKSKFSLELAHIDLGRAEINEKRDCYFTIVNHTDEKLAFDIIKSELSTQITFKELTGEVDPRESKRIYVQIFPVILGHQIHKFGVRSSGVTEMVSFAFYGILNMYLTFPSLQSPNSQLELGPCFINPSKKFAKVQPFEVLNISQTLLSVSATSNLAQQCLIFKDQNLEIPLCDLIIAPSEKVIVYIALQPSLLKPSAGINSYATKGVGKSLASISGALPVQANSENSLPATVQPFEKSQFEQTRNLIGGIRFSVSIVEEMSREGDSTSLCTTFYLLTQTVKFSALIGISNFSVEECFIDMGSSSSPKGFHTGQLTLVNRSPRLPLAFNIECDSENITVEKKSGVIEQMDDENSLLQQPTASVSVSFSLRCRSYGYISEKIVVRNENNPQQVYSTEVRFFADNGFLALFGTQFYRPARVILSQEQLYSKFRYQSKSESDPMFPVIEWENVYVSVNPPDKTADGSPSVFLQKRHLSEVAPSYEQSFEILNTTGELLEIEAKTTGQSAVRWVLSGGGGFVMNSNLDVAETGNLLLQKHQRASVFVSVQSPPSNDDACRRLWSGKNLTVRSVLLIENPEKSLVLKAIDLLVSYGMSLATVEPAFVDVGRVGHLNNWEEVNFSFRLWNQSECTLEYQLELPTAVEVLGIKNELGSSVDCGTIEGNKSHIIEAVLIPKKMNSGKVGPQISQINILNTYNPRNQISVEIRSVLTLLDLKFERLTDGELVLPSLVYPSSLPNSSSDNWFKIMNKTEQDLKFEIEFQPSEYLTDCLRVEFVSRSANSHLNGLLTLDPLGSLDVRVRAYLQENSRMLGTSDRSTLLSNSSGASIGSLLVTTKYQSIQSTIETIQQGSGQKRMTQSIPIRCSIMEGPTFSLSEKRIKFACFPLDSLDISTIGLQSRNIVITNLLKFFPLNFRVAVDYPLEFPLGTNLIEISPLGPENEGQVEANSQLVLSISLVKTNISGISDSVKVHIYDLNSTAGYFQTLQISITESASLFNNTLEALSLARHLDSERDGSISDSVEGTENALSEQDISFTDEPQSIDDGDVSTTDNASFAASGLEKFHSQSAQSNRSYASERRANSLIHLRGCKRIVESQQSNSEPGGLFELDLGQQDISNTIITKRVVLENASNEKVGYRIRTLTDSDKAWIVISRADGVLDSRSSSHSININFIPTLRGLFCTYIIVDNLDNLVDSKIIRTSMAVVGKHSLRRTPTLNSIPFSQKIPTGATETSSVFDVIIAGTDSFINEGLNSDVITMSGLFYDMEYSARSIIIRNRECVPLEFFIKSNLKASDPSELIFSLSRSSAKVFRSVIVQPESETRVFLRYRPSLGGHEKVKMDMATANIIDEKIIEISVNCLLVKDYQKTIYLKSSCRKPQIFLPVQEIVFSGKITKVGEEGVDNDWDIKFYQPFASLTIENLLSDSLVFEVKNDSMYFGVDVDSDIGSSPPRKANCTAVVQPGSSKSIKVVPLMASLLKDVDVVRRQKYFVEQITVYNKNRPSEKYWIVLKLSFGHLSQFSLATGSRHSYVALESQIVRLLRDFNANDSVFGILVDTGSETLGVSKAAVFRVQ